MFRTIFLANAVLLLCFPAVSTVPLTTAPISALSKPSQQQLDWLDLEIGAIFHYTMYTFVSRPSPMNKHEDCTQVFNTHLGQMPPPSTFHPSTEGRFVDNWMNATKAFGGKYAILVAKHCDGFVSFQTKATFDDGTPYGYGVQQSNWQNGKGDLAKDFTDSAREHGINPGLYYNLGNGNYYLSYDRNKGPIHTKTKGQHKVSSKAEYFRIIKQQVTELWSNYGQLSEIWFDSAQPFDHDQSLQQEMEELTKKLQPNTILLQGPSARNGARKGDGETGVVHNPNWYTCPSTMACRGGGLGGQGPFIPSEGEGCAVGDGNSRQWFWHPDHDEHARRKPLSLFWKEYHQSVGLGSNYLIGFTPDRRGLIPDVDMAKFVAFGELVKSCYGSPVATSQSTKIESASDSATLSLHGQSIDRMWVREDITDGQRVTSFSVSVQTEENGAFTTVGSGSSMGRKRIVRFGRPYKATAVKVTVTKAHEFPVPIKEMAAFAPCNDPVDETTPDNTVADTTE